ncbi:hypothetical protein BGW37DRAFT_516439 [Umbelopsis sp. PMI_123]|nr:hypothetical protein BGW37DRAFT_516439 [Umbelopsis sp. PMI_123]
MAPRIPSSLISSRLLLTRVAATPASVTASRNQSTVSTGKVTEDPQIGDYPNLPHLSSQNRSPFGWDDNQDRRNFGETLNEQDEVLGVWAPDLHEYSPYKALAQFGVFVGVLSAFSYLVYKTYPEETAIRRTYPYGGLKQELGGRDGDIKERGARTEPEE